MRANPHVRRLVAAMVGALVLAACWIALGPDDDDGPEDEPGEEDAGASDAGVDVHDAGVHDAGIIFIKPPSPCAPLRSGLVSWYAAEGDATDEMGANPGRLMDGLDFTQGRVGRAFVFEQDAHVAIPSSPQLALQSSVPSTLEAWVRPSVALDAAMPLSIVRPFSFGVLLWPSSAPAPAAPGVGPLVISPARPRVRPHVHDGSAWSYREGPLSLRFDAWSHVVQVWDGATLTLFVNGVAVSLKPLQRGIVEHTEAASNIAIGRWDLRPVRDEVFRFSGAMDEVRIYNRALSPREVQHNYLASSGSCDVTCPPGYQPHVIDDLGVTSCYRLETNGVPWEAAREACGRDGAALTSIHSRDESSFLFDWCMTVPGTNCWTGGNDIAAEGTWVWSDGTPWDYLDVWSHGPDNYMGNQNCLFLWQNGDGASPADDEYCAEPHPFICKAPARRATQP